MSEASEDTSHIDSSKDSDSLEDSDSIKLRGSEVACQEPLPAFERSLLKTNDPGVAPRIVKKPDFRAVEAGWKPIWSNGCLARSNRLYGLHSEGL